MHSDAVRAIEAGNVDAGIASLATVVKRGGENARATYDLARAYALKQRPDIAAVFLDQALDLDPGIAIRHPELAEILPMSASREHKPSNLRVASLGFHGMRLHNVVESESAPQARAAQPRAQGIDTPVLLANGNGVQGSAARWRDVLEARGVGVEAVTNAERFDHSTTLIAHPVGRAHEALELKRRLGITARLVERRRSDEQIVVILGRNAEDGREPVPSTSR